LESLVAVVDDEPDILELVSIHLGRAGFEVKTFPDASGFLRFLKRRVPDLLVLDLMLPDTDGLEICKQLKADDRFDAVPIIMLTARGGEADKVLGLELGADDYVTKPFSPRELVARVRAVLRRKKAKEEETERITVDDHIVIDTEKYEVRVRGKVISLTPTEFKILSLLASNRGRVQTREQILDHLWGHEKAVIDRTVDVHIRNIREKMGKAARLIKNVRGVGYRIE
jgi:two-component system phosphate regulon response regulator PhoB/two-component system alkaline phosphatase synthesis response regulator PhoP